MKTINSPNCNRCQPKIKCSGQPREGSCKHFSPPKEGWQLAELALAHPQSLNDALSVLPFKVNLGFYLNNR